jgi:hypothetical protein
LGYGFLPSLTMPFLYEIEVTNTNLLNILRDFLLPVTRSFYFFTIFRFFARFWTFPVFIMI